MISICCEALPFTNMCRKDKERFNYMIKKSWLLKKGSNGLNVLKEKKPFDYTKFNQRLPKGSGKRFEHTGSWQGWKTCFRCNGKGVDEWGAHCTMCQNNVDLLEDNPTLNRYLLVE